MLRAAATLTGAVVGEWRREAREGAVAVERGARAGARQAEGWNRGAVAVVGAGKRAGEAGQTPWVVGSAAEVGLMGAADGTAAAEVVCAAEGAAEAEQRSRAEAESI